MVEAALLRGQRLPEWAVEPVNLVFGDEFYISAFWELNTCRALGFGVVGPIPWTAIVAFARRQGLDEDLERTFVAVVRTLDDEYLRWQRARLPHQSSGGHG